MDTLIVASMRKSAGKTSAIVGLASVLNRKIGYMKPFGERLLYRKKRLWDYDSALITGIFGLKDDPVDMSIGFDHSKLRYMYDEAETQKKLREMADNIGREKELLFVEGGRDLSHGISIFLDSISIAKALNRPLLIVVSGDEDTILDDLIFLKQHVDLRQVKFQGVLINKVPNVEDFQNIHLPAIQKLGIKVLGVIPYQVELTHFTVQYLADRLFAKVITGEAGLGKVVKNILIGAWSANVFLQDPVFKKESKLVITGGDRTDMILAALESDTSGIILTNNILPPSNIISKAAEKKIPLLMVFSDTYQTAKQIEGLEPLLTKDDAEKIERLKKLVQTHVNAGEIQTR
jgi:BioD-like phosphotransacetylase family protein